MSDKIVIAVIALSAGMLVSVLTSKFKSFKHESVSQLMSKGFYDGCIDAKREHNSNIGIVESEYDQCRNFAVNYKLSILEQLKQQ